MSNFFGIDDDVEIDAEKLAAKQKKIFEMQCPSTQKAMALHQKGSSLREEMPAIPINWKAVPDAKTVDEAVGARALTFQEVKVETTLRYFRGQYLAEMRNEVPVSSITEEKKEKAIGAFMFIKKTFMEIMEMAGLAPVKEKVKVEK